MSQTITQNNWPLTKNLRYFCTMSTRETKLTRGAQTENPDQNQFRKVPFVYWVYRKSNPGPAHQAQIVLKARPQK